jgi:preprotein translocase subunit YajC
MRIIIMLAMLLLFAEDPPAQPPPSPFGGGFLPYLLPVFALMFIIMMWRNSRRQANEQSMLTTLEKNDKVLTQVGIYGTVVSVNPKEDEVTIRVDDNLRLKMSKAAISRNITKEQAKVAAAATAAANKAGAATPPPVPAPQTGVTEKPTT